MSDKKGYWILHVTVRDAEHYKEYVQIDTPIVESFGGKFLVRGGESTVPEGASKDRHVIVEFASLADAKACYESDAYQKAAEIRKNHADSDVILVEGHL